MIAIYAGTFDPFTAGHLSVVGQAAGIFSFVRVLVANSVSNTAACDGHSSSAPPASIIF